MAEARRPRHPRASPGKPPTTGLVVTCEHASRAVPPTYRSLFAGRQRLLDSHHGWDAGAAELARDLSRGLRAPLTRGAHTRLLVDLNRPTDHPRLHGEAVRELPATERRRIVGRYHDPHWRRVEGLLRRGLRRHDAVLHLAVHSFTPRLRGRTRRFDVGLLFDSSRDLERELAVRLRAALRRREPRWRVRFNQPYLGSDPGLTTSMRRRLRSQRYAGLELEVTQRWPRGRPGRWRDIRRTIVEAVRETCAPPAR